MARGVNKVILIGNLGADPETRYTAGGAAITTVRLATSEAWTDKAGEKQERTEWHRVKFFGKLAEIAGEYLKKGRQIYVEGSIRTDKYTAQDGVEKFSTEIIGNEMQMLGGAGDRGEGAMAPRGERSARPAGAVAERGAGGGGGGRDSAPRNAPPADGFEDDDIPF